MSGDRRENIFEDDLDRAGFLNSRRGLPAHRLEVPCLRVDEQPLPLAAGTAWSQSGGRDAVVSKSLHGALRPASPKGGALIPGALQNDVVEPGQSAYFATVADYIHLDPARARLFGRSGALKIYRWSSLPCYLASAGNGPYGWKFLGNGRTRRRKTWRLSTTAGDWKSALGKVWKRSNSSRCAEAGFQAVKHSR